MRHGTSSRRQRSRNTTSSSGRQNNQQRTQVYDSNGPDVRIRGTAHQVAEKYLSLAKDCNSAGNIVAAENYFQHAEHYIRIINENNGSFDSSKVFEKRDEQDGAGNRNMSAQRYKDDVDDLSLPSSILGEPVKKEVAINRECEAVS